MKKTVGELVNEQALAAGYSPVFGKGLISPMNEAFETMRELSDKLQEPMKSVAVIAKSLQPQLDAIEKMKLPEIGNLSNLMIGPVIPESLRDEDGEFYIPPITRPVQEVRIVNPEVLNQPAPQEIPQQNTVSYPLPTGAVWESLTVKFLDGHIVKVSYVGMESKKFDFKDMGFINMKTMKPDKKWELLRAIADNGGALTMSGWNREFGRNVKYELNEGLKRFFQMEENPIPHYNKRQGYRTIFVLHSDQ